MSTIVRFAPSPTGLIHVGNARTALYNWLFAKQTDGRFILRLDDTDGERSREEYAHAIEADLAWLGIHPAAMFRQSARAALHQAAAERLKAAGRLYPCFETPEELEFRRRRQLARGEPPIYDRAALRLGEADKAAFVEAGRRPHWRFLLESGPGREEIGWDDLFRGDQRVNLASLSDPVLVREDGTFLYTLPSVADDLDMGITHVIRGDDHVTNTAVQIQLYRALGGDPPRFGHHNLLTDAAGESLSKRSGAQSVASFREAGYESLAVASLAVLIGTSEPVEPAASLDRLAAGFEPRKVSRAPARFDPAELATVNARLLHGLPFAAVSVRLAELGVHEGEDFWLAVRANCERLADARLWQHVVREEPAPVADPADARLLAAAERLLPLEPWGAGTWKVWTDAVRAETERRGRALYLPIRLALTGLDHGPELAGLLPLIGRSSTLARLRASRDHR